MPPRLLPSDSKTSPAAKRARSADNSAIATPVTESADVVDDSALPPFLRQSREEIMAKFEDLNLKQQARFEQQRLNKDPESPWAQEASNNTKFRNRYLDVRPWDKSRIRLRVPEGISDYINASPIVLRCSKTGQERRYIATQGPKETSVNHFWQMIWHETDTVAVIVMLTQLTEGFREKCVQYFPDNSESDELELMFTGEDGEESEAKVRVKDSTYDEASKTTVRTLQLSHKKQKKTVYHLFFLGWPDYGVPTDENRTALLELIKLSRTKNKGWSNPRIVHCSAGVGRSGTFIALEHLLAELEMGLMDDFDNDIPEKGADTTDSSDLIYATVDSLRQQRMTMVQSDTQYQFLYEIVAEAARARIKEGVNSNRGQDSLGLGNDLLSPSGEPVHKAMRFSRSLRAMMSTLRERSIPRRSSTKENQREADGEQLAKEPELIEKAGNLGRGPEGTSLPRSQSFNAISQPDLAMDSDDSQPLDDDSNLNVTQSTNQRAKSEESQLPDAVPPLPLSSSQEEKWITHKM